MIALERNRRPTSYLQLRAGRWAVVFGLTLLALLAPGCIHAPEMLPLSRQHPIDRQLVDAPPGSTLVPLVKGLNCPTAICFDNDGNLLVAESGIDGREPHIFGYHPDHSYFNIYPWHRNVSFFPTGLVMYGPVSAMVASGGKIYVAHRDRQGKGIIAALGYDGTYSVIQANLPCQGDYGVGDLVISPVNNRLYFGIGMATNSGVVGLDNFEEGWLRQHPGVHDELYTFSTENDNRTPIPIQLRGYHFFTPNPWAGLFGGDVSVTGPFQPFGTSILSRIRSSPIPNGAICSVRLEGGDLKVEATGIHNPRGLAYDEYEHLFICNDGMQMRGTRPVYDDPDSLLRLYFGWYGAPDYSTDGHPISDPRYRPPVSMIIKSGYPDLQPLIDAEASRLKPIDFDLALYANFPSLSGASKMAMVPASGPFKDHRGHMIVALDGDRGPYASGGLKLIGRIGFKIVDVDLVGQTVHEFLHNTADVPASMQPWGTVALERPCDVKFGPDGALYILDFGRMENASAIPRYYPGTGAIFKLVGPGGQ